MDRAPDFTLSPNDARWGKWVTESISSILRDAERQKKEIDASLAGTAATVGGLQKSFLAAGVMMAASGTSSPINATSSSYITKASASVVVPDGRTRAVVSLYGSVALVDDTGIALTPYARFLIAGNILPVLGGSGGVPFAKDPGVSKVNNTCSLAAAIDLAGLAPGSTLSAELQVSTTHTTAYATAYASNYATVSMQATFLAQ